jgi:crescentin
MAKLSDLFGRKGEPGDGGPAQRPSTNGNGGRHISIENFSAVGSRMDEKNKVLRNLLTDSGRTIGELDDLKQAFDKLVTPFNATLRGEFYEIEKKATALEAEAKRLHEDLELSRESNRALESTGLELSNEISTRAA